MVHSSRSGMGNKKALIKLSKNQQVERLMSCKLLEICFETRKEFTLNDLYDLDVISESLRHVTC